MPIIDHRLSTKQNLIAEFMSINEKYLAWGSILLSSPQIHFRDPWSHWSLLSNAVPVVAWSTVRGGYLPYALLVNQQRSRRRAPTVLIWFFQAVFLLDVPSNFFAHLSWLGFWFLKKRLICKHILRNILILILGSWFTDWLSQVAFFFSFIISDYEESTSNYLLRRQM